MSDKIKPQELIDLFGEKLPLRVVSLLLETDQSVSPDEMRLMLKRIAADIEAEKPQTVQDYRLIIREYIKARDAFTKATKPNGGFGQPVPIAYNSPIVLRYREASRKLEEST